MIPGQYNPNSYPPPLEVSCPYCENKQKVYSHYKAINVACLKCGGISSFDNNGALTQQQKLSAPVTATFKVGTVFKIEHTRYVLIGYQVKQELTYKTTWIEYTLYNPEDGCITLSESDGNYTLLKPSKLYLENFAGTYKLNIPKYSQFELYNRYKFKVKSASGELLWNAFPKNPTQGYDYVNPPYMLSCEKKEEEIYWFMGEYVDRTTVKSWLTEKTELPAKEGVAPNQPFMLNFKHDSLIRLTVLAGLIVFVLQLILSSLPGADKEVFYQRFYRNDTALVKSYVSPSFNITVNNSAADVTLFADLNNNWLEADYTLVNETTGEQYYFGQAIEFYSGYEDGEAWSEGSTRETSTVCGLTKGKYHFNVQASDDAQRPVGSFSVTINENVGLESNCVITILCLAAFPAIIYLRKQRFEKKRWYNSDYSPYDT